MSDPTQFLIQSSAIMKFFRHQGIIGKGRDFLTSTPCTIHLFSQLINKKKYALQTYDGITSQFSTKKVNQMVKSTFQYFVSNYCRLLFMSERKNNNSNTVDLLIMYDVNELYGMSLQNIINLQVKNGDVFKQSEIVQFLSQILDSLFLGGYHCFQYLEITPVNIFFKIQPKNRYKYFINNFGLSFVNTKWEKKYYNPEDTFYKKNSNKNIQNAMKSLIFTVGLIALQMCTLQDPQKFYNQNNTIDQKILLKTLEAIKLNYSSDLYNFILSMCIMDEKKRIKIQDIYRKESFLMNAKKIKYHEGKFQSFKKFSGFVSLNNPNDIEYFGDVITEKLQVYRGCFGKQNKFQGYGVYEDPVIPNIFIGQFKKNQFRSGIIIKKNVSIVILNQSEDNKKLQSMELYLSIYNIVSNQNLLYFIGKMSQKTETEYGKLYQKDGSYYQGGFKGIKKHGKGIMWNNTKQQKYEGQWDNDNIEGHGYITQGGKRNQARFRNGKLISILNQNFDNQKNI